MSSFVPTAAQQLRLVIIAGSAGAVPLYKELFGRLDRQLGAPVLLVQHRSAGVGDLEDLVRRRATMDVRRPVPQEPLANGVLYLAPSDAQTRFVTRGEISISPLGEGERVQADPVFVSAAAAYGPALLAVVLSGRLEDGAAGVRAVKRFGGRVIVQDPRTAPQPSMPWTALSTGCVDSTLPPGSIADAIRAFVNVPGAAALFASRPVPWASVDVG